MMVGNIELEGNVPAVDKRPREGRFRACGA